MVIHLRTIDRSYVEVVIEVDNNKIDLGFLNKQQAFYLADELAQKGIDLFNNASWLIDTTNKE